eukprot:5322917-Amphidinium_carterae.1
MNQLYSDRVLFNSIVKLTSRRPGGDAAFEAFQTEDLITCIGMSLSVMRLRLCLTILSFFGCCWLTALICDRYTCCATVIAASPIWTPVA